MDVLYIYILISRFNNNNNHKYLTITTITALPSAWPNETPINISKQKGSSSLGNYVLLNPYTIGYNTPDAIIEQTSALIINAAGKAVAATEETCKSAMSDFKDAFDSRFTANIVNAPGENSYPIAGYSYLIYKSKSMEE